ncbi:MAG: hypothetical protein GXP19_04105 [Gammaproteobacteria bacterium]|nr:hypothetical protein [Gammaproteobacteria bacterium]
MNRIDQSEFPFVDSPFHKGEQAIQSRLDVREKMERFGKAVIRDVMPNQHRAFYSQLPFLCLLVTQTIMPGPGPLCFMASRALLLQKMKSS